MEHGEIAIRETNDGFSELYVLSQDGESLVTFSSTPFNLSLVYPVGAIYISTVATNPATLFGFGTWEEIEDRFLLAAGSSYSAGSTGGETEHTLSIEEMPSHLHKISSTLMWANKTGDVQAGTKTYHVRSEKQTTQLEGGNQPHNNMPAYLTVYMWKRVE